MREGQKCGRNKNLAAGAECIDRESCDTLVKGHPKEFHVIVDHERVPQNSSNLFVHDLQKTGLLKCEDHTGNYAFLLSNDNDN